MLKPENHKHYGDPKYQTVWDTYSTADEVYEALISPIEGYIAWQAQQILSRRAGNGRVFELWQDIFQETTRTLLWMLCTRYRQDPKPGGVTVIPHTHVKTAIIDSVRILIGGPERYPQASAEFAHSITRTNGGKVRLWTHQDEHEPKDTRLESIISALEMNNIIEPGEFDVSDVEEAGFIVSEMSARRRLKRGERAAELWLRIHSHGDDAREIISELLSDADARRVNLVEEALSGY